MAMANTQAFRGCLAAVAAIFVCSLPLSAANRVVIVQTNSAGDNVSVIDPVTNTVVGQITGIEANHGAAVAPDGSRIYVSDEGLSTLDVVDGKTLKVIKQIPLSGHPNNLGVAKDGKRVYVGIIQAPGGVDVIDTASLQRVKTAPTWSGGTRMLAMMMGSRSSSIRSCDGSLVGLSTLTTDPSVSSNS